MAQAQLSTRQRTTRMLATLQRRRKFVQLQEQLQNGHETQTPPIQAQLLLSQEKEVQLSSLQRQTLALEISREHGNQHLQRVAGIVQRQPEEVQVKTPKDTASAVVALNGQPEWNALVQAKLEEFLKRFSNIPVEIQVQENGKLAKQTLLVQPPYFLNAIRTEHSKNRLDKAKANRKAATGKETKAPVAASHTALTGKSTPEELQRILQEAVNTGKITKPKNKPQLDADDLRAWLKKFGIGIDCSGFVSQALNEVMIAVHQAAGSSPEGLKKLAKGSSQLKGGAAGFAPVKTPAELRPGDTVHTPGHIRIIMQVEQTKEGVVFTTAESHAGGKDIGPDRAGWRFPDAAQLKQLEEQKDGTWHKIKRVPTFGRYKQLEQFEQAQKPD